MISSFKQIKKRCRKSCCISISLIYVKNITYNVSVVNIKRKNTGNLEYPVFLGWYKIVFYYYYK